MLGGGRQFSGGIVHERRAATVENVTELPATLADIRDDFALMLGLNDTVSPLRLNGMSGMLWRVKRQIISKMAL